MKERLAILVIKLIKQLELFRRKLEKDGTSAGIYKRKFIKKYGIDPEKKIVSESLKVGKILDVGCGGGKFPKDAIGIDPRPKGVKGLHGGQSGVPSKADVVGYAENLPFTPRSFDTIIFRHSFEHVSDPVLVLNEVKRILRGKGIGIFIIPDDSSVDTINLDRSHKHVYTPESFRRLVEAVGGFEIIGNIITVPEWSFGCVVCKK
ncbi:MAG: class I SAM-dependent methyltransferase [Candidatus Aenigmarchaeota archaeon]|nr:class I SAM-dependent methyltransferase [Candidatus Aenigmarchaeota archaeon]